MRRLLFAVILSAASLAACSGGNSGSVTPPTGGGSTPAPPQKATLGAGFSGAIGSSSQSRHHIAFVHAMASSAPVLGGSIIPFAIFAAPRSDVPKFMPSIDGYQAVAYLTPVNGSALPNPLPTPVFSQSGDPLQFTGPGNGGVPNPPPGGTVIGAENVLGPSSPGQTTVTATALRQSVNITADTYPGLGISAADGGQKAPTGFSFPVTGAVVDTTTPGLIAAQTFIMAVAGQREKIPDNPIFPTSEELRWLKTEFINKRYGLVANHLIKAIVRTGFSPLHDADQVIVDRAGISSQ